MLTAHGDKYYIYLHLSSNSSHKWPLRAQVMSAVARGYSGSHTTFQFLTPSVWAKLQRRQWKFTASLSHALRAANPRSTDGGEFKRVSTHFFFLWTQWFTQARTAQRSVLPLRRRVPYFKGRISGKQRRHAHFSGTWGERIQLCSAQLKRGNRYAGEHPQQGSPTTPSKLLSCPFPSSSKHFRLGIILTWNRGFPEVWKRLL